MLLVLRELLMGSRRYNDLRRGLPLISPTVLTQRLKDLQSTGLVRHDVSSDGRSGEYHLTAAGEELRPLVVLAGTWGQRWVRSKMTREDLDAGLLMWDIHRNVRVASLPDVRTVIHFEFPDAKKAVKRWWLLIENGEVGVCIDDPGYEIDLSVVTDVRTMTQVWMGDLSLASARSTNLLKVTGNSRLAKTMGDWLGRSQLAHVKPAIAATTAAEPCDDEHAMRPSTAGVPSETPPKPPSLDRTPARLR